MVRDDVENKVANEGCKPEWNELLHMLERRLQRYIEEISSPHFRDFGNGFFEQISRVFCKDHLSVSRISARIPQNFPEIGKNHAFFGKLGNKENLSMMRKDPKCKCEKRSVTKAASVCRLYSKLQSVYLDILQKTDSIETIQCNVPLDGLSVGAYTSDFLCKCKDGSFLVRECVERKFLAKPMTIALLDASREFWNKRGISNWGIVTNHEKTNV